MCVCAQHVNLIDRPRHEFAFLKGFQGNVYYLRRLQFLTVSNHLILPFTGIDFAITFNIHSMDFCPFSIQ